MLQQRIKDTVRFFDYQGIPLTLLEVYKYLLASRESIQQRVDGSYELHQLEEVIPSINIDTVLFTLDDLVDKQYLERRVGYYCLPGRHHLVAERLRSYAYGIQRWRRLRRYAGLLRFVPFVRGVAINGSQVLGKEQQGSDIDLFVITEEKFLWSARTFVTGFFQILGVRRYGNRIANRFCLNHYIAGLKQMERGRTMYTAMEYLKLRPFAYPAVITQFKQRNLDWMSRFFPNSVRFAEYMSQEHYTFALQKFFEKVYVILQGERIESWLSAWQMKRIRQEKYIVVASDELSFHPSSKQEQLLQDFFQNQTD